MSTKADLIAEVAAKSWKGWYRISSDNLSIPGADGKTMSEYTVNYAEQVGGEMRKVNVQMTVYQEGQPDEDAQWARTPKKADTARSAVQTFLEGMANVVRARIDQLDEEALYGFATVWRTIDATTAQEVKVFVWKDDGQPIKARELV